ncbi:MULTISPECIES: hypothetical protein [unclassified Tolypothrix]|nr:MULTISPECIES: hypothetical protein [unclassified Tolypothrix]MBE9084071.1 hypothetical protein [Tolypothrix sp. LEGE 11397]UYD31005.1 hypothetical protein HGR01_39860 [Tolypothrix sp. PCC 7712]UYD38888.1 hypothetical protein HG267_40945 [Tolypothrix sp. PCC 7601]BAY95961.1 hypothetical protein NIES3275_80380 [Microchaete diplosiphon NIES-3275]
MSKFKLIFALITVLAATAILTTSSCGGSANLKLFPPEFHFNKNNCSPK